MSFTLDIRPEVAAFAVWMETVLRQNDHKGGWDHMHPMDLLARIAGETQELRDAIFDWQCRPDSDDAKERLRVASEAADVANFCLMIVDVVGALDIPKDPAALQDFLNMKDKAK